MRNAGWTEGIAYSPASKSFALMRNISEAQKQGVLSSLQARSKIEQV
jgi:hypothetical protein